MGDNEDRLAVALNRLPVPYSLALRLRDAGIDEVSIAQCLGIEPEAWGTFLAVAVAKLAAAGYPEAGRTAEF